MSLTHKQRTCRKRRRRGLPRAPVIKREMLAAYKKQKEERALMSVRQGTSPRTGGRRILW